jgi:hypothetical protein
MTAADALARLLNATAVEPQWFGASFLAAVPIDKINEVLTDATHTLGAFQSVTPNGGRFTVTFARGTLQADAFVDDTGAFTGLIFSRMQSTAAAERLAAIFGMAPVPAEWFSDRMLDAVPIEKAQAILAWLDTKYGAFRSATPAEDGSYDVAFAMGGVQALIVLGPDGKIEGLIFQPRAA